MAELTTNLSFEINHDKTEKVGTYIDSIDNNFSKLDAAFGQVTTDINLGFTNVYSTIQSLYGLSGEITLLTTDWAGTTCTKTFADMGDNDLIVFTPSTKNDKTNFETCNPFVSSNGNIVTFEVESVPSANITLKFFITRGTL